MQGRGSGGSGSIFLFRHLGGWLELYFFLGADNLLTVDFHDFKANDFVPNEAHELDILRRLSINPFFVFGLVLMLPNLLRRTPLGECDHIVVHADEHAMVLNRLLHLGGNGFEVGLFRRLGIEIEYGPEDFFEFLARHLGNVVIEVHIDEGAPGIGIGIGWGNWDRTSATANADALVPLLLPDGAAVDFDVNEVVLEDHVRDAGGVAILGCRTPHGQRLLQISTAGSDDSVLKFETFAAH